MYAERAKGGKVIVPASVWGYTFVETNLCNPQKSGGGSLNESW